MLLLSPAWNGVQWFPEDLYIKRELKTPLTRIHGRAELRNFNPTQLVGKGFAASASL